jgi:type VI secretion system protein ImpL
MRKVLSFLALAPVSGFIAAAIIIASVWFLSGLLPFLDGMVMWIIIGVVVALYLLLVGIWYWRRRKRNKAMLAEIAPEPDPTGEAISAQQQDLQAKFASAMRDLSKLKFKSKSGGSRYIYELPWYIFIGPPGAGKTEALKNCGLEFPLRKGDGPISIDGGAGTRDCDWVFTNEAVFIDTAGRYTTQTSDKSVDSASWTSFLDLLRKYRPREPINGVIVAISVKDLAVASAEELDDYAKSVRQRLQEVCERMQAQVPVYVMFTKADLLIGFTEFFQSMRPQEREQVWGTTFPLGDVQDPGATLPANLAGIGDDLDNLLEQLGEMHFTRLQEEADLGSRSRIFGFPAQFSTLKPVIQRFMDQTFGADRYSQPMLLRGMYFTSATQIGQPVDRLVATLAREFGVEQRAVATMGGSGRSYFLSDLLRKVVFPEQGLITQTAKRKSSVGRYAAIAASILVPLAFAGGLFMVYQHNQAQAASFNTAIEDYKTEIASLPVSPVDDNNFVSILPALAELREEALRLKSEEAEAPLLGLGVDDTEVIAARAGQSYDAALDNLLRPRIMYRYERLIEENLHRPGELYSILKTYLMVAGAGPLNTQFVKDQVSADWLEQYNPIVDGATLTALDEHLEAMLADEFLDPRELNNEAVALAREAIAQTTIAERAFRSLRSSPEAIALEPWSPVSTGGGSTQKVFVRLSGKPLDEPIPGLFTYDGFWAFFLQRAGVAANAALEETWLIVDDAETRTPNLETITREMFDLYYDEYVDRWQSMLEDLRISPFGNAQQAADILVALSSNTSPLKRILDSASKETRLAVTPGEDSRAMSKIKQLGSQKVLAKFGAIGQVGLAAAAEENKFGRPVQDTFEPLYDFTRGAESTRVMAALREFYAQVSDLARGGEDISLLSTTPEAKQLKDDVAYAPPAVKKIFMEMLEQADSTSSAGVRARIAEAWSSTAYPQCRDLLHGRFPFGNGVEIPQGDMTAVLGPNGAIDGFFQRELAQYVNTTVSPWRWRPGVGAALGMAQDRLYFFEQAAVLRDALYPNGSREPTMKFTVYPITLDDGVGGVGLNVGGVSARFSSVDETPKPLEWPGVQAANGATASLAVSDFINPETGAPETKELTNGKPGTWGLFYLVDELGFRAREGGARGRIRIALGGRSATLELRMRSSNNPLALRDAMAAFRCPASL